MLSSLESPYNNSNNTDQHILSENSFTGGKKMDPTSRLPLISAAVIDLLCIRSNTWGSDLAPSQFILSFGDCCVFVCYSASTANMAKLEEMERLLREAQAEKRSLLEHKVTPRIRLAFFRSFPNRNVTFLFLVSLRLVPLFLGRMDLKL